MCAAYVRKGKQDDTVDRDRTTTSIALVRQLDGRHDVHEIRKNNSTGLICCGRNVYVMGHSCALNLLAVGENAKELQKRLHILEDLLQLGTLQS